MQHIEKYLSIKPTYCIINDNIESKNLDMIISSFNASKDLNIIIIIDHDTPAGTYQNALIHRKLIDFSKENNIELINSKGIGYQILMESYVKGGDIIISMGKHGSYLGAVGALYLPVSIDQMIEYIKEFKFSMQVPKLVSIELNEQLPPDSTMRDFVMFLLTEKFHNNFENTIIEFYGQGLTNLSLDDKITLCIGASQMGAISGIINERNINTGTVLLKCNLLNTEPMITLPGNLTDTVPIKDLEGLRMDAGFIGGCYGGRIDSLRSAAEIIKGHKIKFGFRLTVSCASNEIFMQALKEGIIDKFLDFGAQVVNPSCACCYSESLGVIGDEERLISTGSFNYPGCIGTSYSLVYLASSESVVKAAINGSIT